MASSSSSSSSSSPDQLQAKFDLGIALVLSSWEALSLAVQNHWGGPDSADKRDWFAGAVSELFTTNPETDAGDLEEFLLQVMEDEFELDVEDGSEMAITASILQIKDEITRGDFTTVDKLWHKYKAKKTPVKAMRVGPSSDDEDSLHDEFDEDDEDIDMSDDDNAVPQHPARSKPEPEVDEDGFTKVFGRRR